MWAGDFSEAAQLNKTWLRDFLSEFLCFEVITKSSFGAPKEPFPHISMMKSIG